MEDEIDARRFVRAIIRRWPWVIAAALISTTVGLFLAAPDPELYEAEAWIATSEAKISLPQLEVLATSPEILSEIVAALRRDGLTWPDSLSALASALEAVPQVRADLLSLHARANDPELAQALSNAWAEAVVAEASDLYGEGLGTLAALEERLNEAERKLIEAEQALVTVQSENMSIVLRIQLDLLSARLRALGEREHAMQQIILRAGELRDQLVESDPDIESSYFDELSVLILQVQWITLQEGALVQMNFDPAFLDEERTLSSEQVNRLGRLLSDAQGRMRELPATEHALQEEILRVQGTLHTAETVERAVARERDLREEDYIILAQRISELKSRLVLEGGTALIAMRATMATELAGQDRLSTALLAGSVGITLGILGIILVDLRRPEPLSGKDAG
ncbi:MAG: hypothetical protein IIA89_10770 [Chloroflexi bacterium]|nr:hypothetical protein [Chloroflexota bacterium]